MDMGLDGKVALVMAGSRGLGRAAAWSMAGEGARVIVASRHPETVFEIRDPVPADASARVATRTVDLQDENQYATLADQVVGEYGQLDVLLVNTAGPRLGPWLGFDANDWDAAYRLLVRPALTVAREAARHMVERRRGSIIFLTSTWLKQPVVGSALSAVMRSSLSAAVKQMALELAPSGVRVNQVMPGSTLTDRMEEVVAAKVKANHTTREAEVAQMASRIPMGRCGEPREVADAVTFLASDRASFITGTTIPVDGGTLRSTL
ncbi:MAG TPA: SDR family oxidoreductase [Nevskiaceae bacterium]